MSLCELVVGGKEGLQPIEKTVIDRCVRLVYREQALGLETAKTPLLQDLYEELLRQPEPEARRVATALELYCTGSLNLFNHPTNVKTDSSSDLPVPLMSFFNTLQFGEIGKEKLSIAEVDRKSTRLNSSHP